MENIGGILRRKFMETIKAVPKDVNYIENILKVVHDHIQICEEETKRQDEELAKLRSLYDEEAERSTQLEIKIEKLLFKLILRKAEKSLKNLLKEEYEKLLNWQKNLLIELSDTVGKSGIQEPLLTEVIDHVLKLYCVVSYFNDAEIAIGEVYGKRMLNEVLQEEYDRLKKKVEAEELRLLDEIRKRKVEKREEQDTLRCECDESTRKLEELEKTLMYHLDLDDDVEKT